MMHIWGRGRGRHSREVGSLYVTGKLPTYPSPKPTLTLTSNLGQNVSLGEEQVGSFPAMYNDQECLGTNVPPRLSNPDTLKVPQMWTTHLFFKTSDHTLFMMLKLIVKLYTMYLAPHSRRCQPISFLLVHTCLGQIRECPTYPRMDTMLL